ncbi:MAG: class I SAM-dependent methyltransferase [Candidatus Thermoplasmatota archaeon]|nr:class I SAM-dependent methyltransferase [Candidatus Thermoplasmatota archaeon]
MSEYTRRAFSYVPHMDSPRILDVGCGSGVPTMELARLCDGTIDSIDLDGRALELLRRKVAEAGLVHRITIIQGSIDDMVFPEGSYDIIWSEGTVFVMGFQRSIREWGRFLRKGGVLVVHDEDRDRGAKIASAIDAGYLILGLIELSEDIWYESYFLKIERLLIDIMEMRPSDPELIEEMEKDRLEIDRCRQKVGVSSSFFVILLKA